MRGDVFDVVGDALGEPSGQVAAHAAGAKVVDVHARARYRLVKLHQSLAVLERPQERRHRPDVDGLRGKPQQMVQDARDLGEHDTDVLRPERRLAAQQLLDGKGEGVLLGHRRDVVQTVEIGQRLEVGLVLDQLLGAAVQ